MAGRLAEWCVLHALCMNEQYTATCFTPVGLGEGEFRWKKKLRHTLCSEKTNISFYHIVLPLWIFYVSCIVSCFFIFCLPCTRSRPYWTHCRGVYKQCWLEKFKFRIGLEMASNAQPWWTSGSSKRWPSMKMNTAFYRLMVPSCIYCAKMASTKWVLDTVALSGYVTICVFVWTETQPIFFKRKKLDLLLDLFDLDEPVNLFPPFFLKGLWVFNS